MKEKSLAHFIWPLAMLIVLTPWISSGLALLLGLVLSLIFGNPYATFAKEWIHRLLTISVMGLGAGMNLHIIGQVGYTGIGYTVAGIATAMVLGFGLGRLLQVNRDVSLLISVGTAICGGSAIAAVAPVIRAKQQEVSVALATVFALNAIALLLFPWLGHLLDLSQTQFGLWSALAIHDTSSVVGATLQYGTQALEVGTTVKLARALWIIPVALLIGLSRSQTDKTEASVGKSKKPWFILGFLIAAALVTWIPALAPAGHEIEGLAKKLMVLTLFLIGSSLNREAIRSVGVRPFVQGIALWLLMGVGTLAAIYFDLMSL